jgi:hypothetical protein
VNLQLNDALAASAIESNRRRQLSKKEGTLVQLTLTRHYIKNDDNETIMIIIVELSSKFPKISISCHNPRFYRASVEITDRQGYNSSINHRPGQHHHHSSLHQAMPSTPTPIAIPRGKA